MMSHTEILGADSAMNMRFGIIVVREFEEHADKHLMPLIDRLVDLGCMSQNIVVKTIPTLHDATVMTQFFAQYTDVDAVAIVVPQNRAMGTLSLMNGITRIQVQWGMVVEIGGAECADYMVEMVQIQNEMELDAPEENQRACLS